MPGLAGEGHYGVRGRYQVAPQVRPGDPPGQGRVVLEGPPAEDQAGARGVESGPGSGPPGAAPPPPVRRRLRGRAGPGAAGWRSPGRRPGRRPRRGRSRASPAGAGRGPGSRPRSRAARRGAAPITTRGRPPPVSRMADSCSRRRRTRAVAKCSTAGEISPWCQRSPRSTSAGCTTSRHTSSRGCAARAWESGPLQGRRVEGQGRLHHRRGELLRRKGRPGRRIDAGGGLPQLGHGHAGAEPLLRLLAQPAHHGHVALRVDALPPGQAARRRHAVAALPGPEGGRRHPGEALDGVRVVSRRRDRPLRQGFLVL